MARQLPGNKIPEIGDIVIYTSRNGDGVQSPAIVLRTKETTNLKIINRWETAEDSLSGNGRPADLVPELPDDMTVDLKVMGLGGDYIEYCVPYSAMYIGRNTEPRTWNFHVQYHGRTKGQDGKVKGEDRA